MAEVGRKYNSLTVVCHAEPRLRNGGGKRDRIICKCDCGDESEYDASSVRVSNTTRCIKCARKSSSEMKTTHGLSDHILYRKWRDMINRCRNPNTDRYHCYGALGIDVCEEWLADFKSFYDWSIDNGWSRELQIERIDVYKGYSPDNCKYITAREQGYNKRNTFYVYYNGKEYSLAEVAYKNNVKKKYSGMHLGISKNGKSMDYYVKKLGLNMDF